jgi:N-acetylmuramoyl-L-alanine amidase
LARCPFATWKLISGPVGPYVSGPLRIVHHTTEGASAQGAFDAFEKNRSDPHFTVDSQTIYQHIDTSLAARALRNAAGGVETNKLSAVQIEAVGFAHKRKSVETLRQVARLCRWIEATHHVPLVWPNGLPKPATPGGQDPGGHNRNAENWRLKGGHYGHCHVPENTHWDPGYTREEVNFLMQANFDKAGKILYQNELEEQFESLLTNQATVDLSQETSTMEEHGGDFDEYDRY